MSKRAPLSFDASRIAPALSSADVASALQVNTQTHKHENEQTETQATRKPKGRVGRQFIAAHVVPEAAKQFRLLTVQRDSTTQAMLVEAINDLFVKYGLSRIADD